MVGEMEHNASIQLQKVSDKIRENLGNSRQVVFDFSLENLRKIPNAGEWKRDRRGGRRFIFSRAAILAILGVTENDLAQVSEELRAELDAAISSYYAEQEEENTRKQYKISLSPNEKEIIEESAQLQGVSWSEYVSHAAIFVALESRYLAQELKLDSVNTGQLIKLIDSGRYLWDAFAPDEVEKAITATGLDYATGKKLMAELERLRDARMNPEAGSMDVLE